MSEPSAIPLDIVAIEVTYPTRTSSSFTYGPGRFKPKATVEMIREDARAFTYHVPVKVARTFESTEPELPCPFEAARELLLGLERKLCFSTLVDALSRRDHSEAELRSKLAIYGYFPTSIDEAVARAAELHYLDDERFIERFVEERVRRGWGRRKIELELRRKGVDPTSIEGYPERYFSYDDEQERARSALSRKAIPSARAYEKLVRFLVGRGFSYAVASDVVKERLSHTE